MSSKFKADSESRFKLEKEQMITFDTAFISKGGNYTLQFRTLKPENPKEGKVLTVLTEARLPPFYFIKTTKEDKAGKSKESFKTKRFPEAQDEIINFKGAIFSIIGYIFEQKMNNWRKASVDEKAANPEIEDWINDHEIRYKAFIGDVDLFLETAPSPIEVREVL